MDQPVGSAVPVFGSLTERQTHDFTPACSAKHAQSCGRDRELAQPALQSEIDQRACRVRRELDAGAAFLKPFGLFEHGDAKAVAR
jgi:hypothetical protein